MTLLQLREQIDKAIKEGWGDECPGVMQKSLKGPGYIPVPVESAEIRDWSGWGNTSFCIVLEENEE